MNTSSPSSPSALGADRSFLARYGATILRGGIAAIPGALFRYQAELALTPQEVWFVCYILASRWSTDLPRPSLKRMAERTGLSEQQLHRIKNNLIAKRRLLIVARHNPQGGQTTNAYDFGALFGQLEDLLRRDGAPGEEEAEEGEEGPPEPPTTAGRAVSPPTNAVLAPPLTSATGAPPLTPLLALPRTPVLAPPLTAGVAPR